MASAETITTVFMVTSCIRAEGYDHRQTCNGIPVGSMNQHYMWLVLGSHKKHVIFRKLCLKSKKYAI